MLRAARRAGAKSDAERFLMDVDVVTRGAARLQVRLRDKPLCAFEPAMTALLIEALCALGPVLTHLSTSVEHAVTGKDLRDAAME